MQPSRSIFTALAFAPFAGLVLFAGAAKALPLAEPDMSIVLAQAFPEADDGESPDEAAPGEGTPADPVMGDDASASTPDDTVRAPRPRVVRETTISPLDTERGEYRNPKRALFLSLVVPGLGQAYVGQSTFNYVRAGAYFATEVTLGVLWYQYTVVKYDREVARFRRLADEHWDQGTYENAVAGLPADQPVLFETLNPYRGIYCDAVQPGPSTSGLNRGCREPYSSDAGIQQDYATFRATMNDDTSAVARSTRRANFPSPVDFYELIGQRQEFIFGWSDAQGANYNLSDSTVMGTSAHRDRYNAMRQQAKDYSRMQAWFIGGIILNHIASAVDAALTARYYNRVLYESEARWYDRLHLDGGLAFDHGTPRTHMTAWLSF